jgi:uncharacterized membrane protein
VKNVLGTGEELTVTSPFREAFQNYPRKLGGSLWMTLFIFLWSLLLIIPGIIAAYRYRMATYLLIDHPEMSPLECIRASKQMMAGHKGELFVLDLSFIGWYIVGSLCCGVGTLWVAPYYEATRAQIYEAVRSAPVIE